MKFSVICSVMMLSLGAACADSGVMLKPQSFEAEFVQKLGYHYLLAMPEGYEADEAKKWPLLVFLHGAGERGSDLELLKKHGPPKLLAAGKKLEAIVVCPQVPAGEAWNPHGVKALVDKLVKEFRVDESRVYLTGISMGGFGTWETILEYPETFAAAAPGCGGAGIGILKFDRIKELPLWIFHGEADTVVPVAYTTSAQVRLKDSKGLKVTIYPGVGHDSWTQTYDNPEFWAWIFAQKRD
ncbi:prolyl oligopeptidase family serine peptidase [Phragmitibacter flavus]|nr:prolyl oligopeptidase family serine peptidase [Phragmitibacter flavus]